MLCRLPDLCNLCGRLTMVSSSRPPGGWHLLGMGHALCSALRPQLQTVKGRIKEGAKSAWEVPQLRASKARVVHMRVGCMQGTKVLPLKCELLDVGLQPSGQNSYFLQNPWSACMLMLCCVGC